MDTHDEDIDDGNDTEEMNVGSPTASQVVDYFADQQNDNWDDEVERLNYPAPVDHPIPPHLKEISSLASWTVSTYKPGSGVSALRHPSPSQFWQSDGPQPHTLNVHFFKLVAISYMRIYIDFQQDESYTPIKLEFLAGTGHHDLQIVCEMAPKEPKGWIEVDLSNAGGPIAVTESELRAIDEEEELAWAEQHNDTPETPQEAAKLSAARKQSQRWHKIGTGPTLRCFLVQLRILENHQNGKDTHLRGLQIYARDETYVVSRRRQQPTVRTLHPRGSMSQARRITAELGDTNDVFGDGGGTTWMNNGTTRRSIGGASITRSPTVPETSVQASGTPTTRPSNSSYSLTRPQRTNVTAEETTSTRHEVPAAERIIEADSPELVTSRGGDAGMEPEPESAAAGRKREVKRMEPDWMGEIERGIGGWELR